MYLIGCLVSSIMVFGIVLYDLRFDKTFKGDLGDYIFLVAVGLISWLGVLGIVAFFINKISKKIN